MDANGTRFHLLLAQDDWSRRHPPVLGAQAPGPGGPSTTLAWHAEKGGFTLVSLPTDLPPSTGTTSLGPELRRGAGADAFGNWFWIEGDRRSISARWVRRISRTRLASGRSAMRAMASGSSCQSLPQPSSRTASLQTSCAFGSSATGAAGRERRAGA